MRPETPKTAKSRGMDERTGQSPTVTVSPAHEGLTNRSGQRAQSSETHDGDARAEEESSARGFWTWCREKLYKQFLEPLVLSRHPPWFDARGVAMGLLIGLLIPVGGQIATLTALRIVFRFNYVASLAFSLVSNPLNMIPLYYGYYCLGSFILGTSVTMNFELFQKLMNPIMDQAYFWEAISEFMRLGWEILIRWFVAAVVLSVVFTPLGYFVTLRIQTNRLKKAAAKLGAEYEKYLEELEANLHSGQRR